MSPLIHNPTKDEEAPILIIGGGPSGLLLAFLLEQLNVRSLIIERYPTRLAAPKAHALSPRSLEFCRQAGLDVNEIRSLGSPREDAYWNDNEVITTVEDRAAQKEYRIKSRHVIACDGAKSAVRKHLGITSEGEEATETMMTIHIKADLRPVIKERVGMLHWVMDPQVSGFIIGYELSGNQVLICNFDSEKHPVDSWNEEHCRKVVDAAFGVSIPYDVLSFRPWLLSRKVAHSYRAGNVFLAGDAAHSFPPTGGLGLNSGLGDVHNLAYKLAAVHHGWGGDDLLDTYQAERRQVALINAEQSVKNGKQIFGLLKALGTTDPDLEVSRKNLYRNIQDPEAMVEINKGIEGQREHFDNLGLHIGYVYGDTQVPKNVSLFKSLCVPGARLPHAWIEVLTEQLPLPAIDSSYVRELSIELISQKRFSTLDLCRLDSFTLLVYERNAAHLKSSVKRLFEILPAHLASVLSLRVVVYGVDFALQPGLENAQWADLMGLSGHAVLVRPDQHILACLPKSSGPEELLESLQTHLSW
ncbi:unnamed protein product [Penicillium pancosmium]